MDKSNVLLSQSEIDALLDFLTQKKVSSTTMDQASIDRLISFLQSNDGHNFAPTSVSEDEINKDTSIILLPNNENLTAPGSFCLTVNLLPSGFIEVLCTSQTSGNSYKITPACVEHYRYIDTDTESWGFAIAPSFFDRMASLLKAKYTRETYETVCKQFAKSCYGSESAVLPNVYLPSKNSIIENMII